MAARTQTALFSTTIPAAPADPEHLRVAARLPPGVFLGASSWSFPGWGSGLVWSRSAPAEALVRDGLPGYAAHPLLAAVSLDRTYYGPVPAAELRPYAEQVPERFRFIVKAYRALTDAADPRFLDPAFAADAVVGPTVEGLGEKLGVLLFQFPPQTLPAGFLDRLAAFLAALPRGVRVAVEPRMSGVFGPGYAEALAAGGAAHCLSIHPALPPLREQWKLAGIAAAPFLSIRWNLRPGMDYETAKQKFTPFDKLAQADPERRDAIARAALWATARERPVFVTINNKAEGSAPASVFALAARIAELTGE